MNYYTNTTGRDYNEVHTHFVNVPLINLAVCYLFIEYEKNENVESKRVLLEKAAEIIINNQLILPEKYHEVIKPYMDENDFQSFQDRYNKRLAEQTKLLKKRLKAQIVNYLDPQEEQGSSQSHDNEYKQKAKALTKAFLQFGTFSSLLRPEQKENLLSWLKPKVH